MDSGRPATEWKDYVTRRPHGDRPAGLKCQVRRNEEGLLQVRFEDGYKITLPPNWYASGPEEPPDTAGWMEPMVDYLSAKHKIPPDKVVELFSHFTSILSKYQEGSTIQGIAMNDVLYYFDEEFIQGREFSAPGYKLPGAFAEWVMSHWIQKGKE